MKKITSVSFLICYYTHISYSLNYNINHIIFDVIIRT